MSDFSGLVVVPGHPNGLIFPPKLIFGGLNDFSELVCLFGKEWIEFQLTYYEAEVRKVILT